MPSTKDLIPATQIRAAFIGYPGTGKTIAEASFIDAGPMYIFDLDGRMAPIKKMFPDKDITYDTFNPYEYEKFHEKLNFFLDQISSSSFPFKTVAIDSLTALARLSTNYSKSFRKGKGLGKGPIQISEYEDYNTEASAIAYMLSVLRSLPCHTILTAHVIEAANAANPLRLLTGGKAIAAETPSYFDEVYSFHAEQELTGEVLYKAYTIPRNGLPGKTALNLPKSFDHTNGSFYKLLKAHLEIEGIKLD